MCHYLSFYNCNGKTISFNARKKGCLIIKFTLRKKIFNYRQHKLLKNIHRISFVNANQPKWKNNNKY